MCTHSVVDGDDLSGWEMLVCLLVCGSMGEEGMEESVISSISSWDDWGLLVFFLLKACLNELRNCKRKPQNNHECNMMSNYPLTIQFKPFCGQARITQYAKKTNSLF